MSHECGCYTNLKNAFAHFVASLTGSGNNSYIDSVILRDAEANFAWTTEGNNVLDVRTFYVQNWRSDVMAILDSDGNPLERVRYTAYGTPSSHPIADIDGDGTVNATDQSQWSALVGGTSNSAVYAIPDLNADGLFPDDADTTFFDQQYTRVGAGSAFGMNKLSSVASRKGYAGYEWDGSITSWHVRHRVLDSASGKWTRMDPLGYVDGASNLAYALQNPIRRKDSKGLCSGPLCHKRGIPSRFPCLGINCYEDNLDTGPTTIPIGNPESKDILTTFPGSTPGPGSIPGSPLPPSGDPLIDAWSTSLSGGVGVKCCGAIGPIPVCVELSVSIETGHCICESLDGSICITSFTKIKVCLSGGVGVGSPGCAVKPPGAKVNTGLSNGGCPSAGWSGEATVFCEASLGPVQGNCQLDLLALPQIGFQCDGTIRFPGLDPNISVTCGVRGCKTFTSVSSGCSCIAAD